MHASLDKNCSLTSSEETNEILLQESLSCVDPLNHESMGKLLEVSYHGSHALMRSFVLHRLKTSRFPAIISTRAEKTFAVAFLLQTKRAAEKYESWLSMQNKSNNTVGNDRVGLRDKKRSLLVDEAFGVPSKPGEYRSFGTPS